MRGGQLSLDIKDAEGGLDRFSGFIALIIAILCCSYAFWRPERVINIAHPVYIAFSSFFLGIFVSQFSSRVERFPVVTVSGVQFYGARSHRISFN
mmetsp:Transcript_17363/g.70441  ORF Transcript_17363/g.70441 Transcript_17363/m.70441 type:complete len:95 (-) Transcript_17363:1244-1528(-)